MGAKLTEGGFIIPQVNTQRLVGRHLRPPMRLDMYTQGWELEQEQYPQCYTTHRRQVGSKP